MDWIKKHLTAILLTIAAIFLAGSVASYYQMAHYNNYETANWLIVLTWLTLGLTFAAAGILNCVIRPVFPMHPKAPDLRSITEVYIDSKIKATPASKSPLQRVREHREIAVQYRRNAEALDEQAEKVISEMEAELIAAKSLREVAK